MATPLKVKFIKNHNIEYKIVYFLKDLLNRSSINSLKFILIVCSFGDALRILLRRSLSPINEGVIFVIRVCKELSLKEDIKYDGVSCIQNRGIAIISEITPRVN